LCSQVSLKTHPWIHWLEPNDTYSLEQIDTIISTVQFILDEKEQRFFIFSQADKLSPACCNRLLKTVEEPHQGYYFIFLTNQPDALLTTLKSRCISKSFLSEQIQHSYQEILQPFINQGFNNPIQFMKTIDKYQIKENETKEILDLLLEHFYKILKTSITDQQKAFQLVEYLIIIKQALHQLPLPGSYKLFWKNIYLTFHQQLTCLKK